MDIEKKVQILRACSSKKGNRCSSCPAFGQGNRNCMRNAMKDAATALSTLQAENEEMQKQLNMFSEFLCHMTGGLLSKTNYTTQEMISAAEDYQQNVCGECDLRAENEKLRDELEKVKQKYNEAREAICTHCMDVPCRGESCYWWRGQKED